MIVSVSVSVSVRVRVAVVTPHVLGLGVTRLGGEAVSVDSAGHPFRVVKRRGWAEPIPH